MEKAYSIACDEVKNPHRYRPIAKGPLLALGIILLLTPIAFVWILKTKLWDR